MLAVRSGRSDSHPAPRYRWFWAVAACGLSLAGRHGNPARAGKLIALEGHPATISVAAFSPDNQRIATGDTSGTVRVSDVQTGVALFTVDHVRGFKGLVFSRDGKFLLTCADDETDDQQGNVRVWDAATGELVSRGKAGVSGKELAVTPDGSMLVAHGLENGTFTVYLLNRAGQLRETFQRRGIVTRDALYQIVCPQDGLDFFAMAANAPPQHVAQGAGSVHEILGEPSAGVLLLACRNSDSPDGLLILRLWDVRRNRELKRCSPGLSQLGVAAMTRDAARLAVRMKAPGGVSRYPSVVVCESKTERPVANLFDTELGNWHRCEFSPDGNKLAILGVGTGGAAAAWVWHVVETPVREQKPPRGPAAPAPDDAAAAPRPANGNHGVEVRGWTSADGRFSIRARLVRLTETAVVLQPHDGSDEIVVPLAKLSAADRQYVQDRPDH